MRASSSTTILRAAARAFAPAPLPARTTAVRAAVAFRPLSTSVPLLKKSKAAATKKSQKQGKEHEEVEGGDKVRYEQSLEADADAILEKTQSKMEKSVEWAKGLVYDAVERGRGRVSPALLDGVKVEVEGMGMQNLNTVASITVKGNVLFISVWDQSHMKDVQSAVRKANIPGVSPQRVDDTSFRCPIARPTFELRQELIKSIGANIETAKNQVRKARTDGLNSLGGKGEPGTDDVQKLADKFGGMLDDSLSQLKKELA